MTPELGGVVELAGARLEVPPGSLVDGATLGLAQVTVPHDVLPSHDPARAGQIILADFAFAITVAAPVALAGPIFVDLPLDAARIPEGRSIADAHASALFGGQLVVQQDPESVDDEHVRMRFEPAFLPPLEGSPRASGIAFTVLVSALQIGGAALLASPHVQPLVASMDDVRSIWAYSVHQTEHFHIRYRGDVTDADLRAVGDALEAAHALLYDELGFRFPDPRPFMRRYVVYLDDLREHFWLPDPPPDGVTYPGNSLLSGASYVTTHIARDTWPRVAVHEYAHALQWGSTTRVSPSSWATFLDPESVWLFEGHAVATSGRIMAGGIPARQPGTDDQHIPQGFPVYAPPEGVPTDFTQDFFVFLEQRLGGDAGFYAEVFESLEDESPSAPIEPSVDALDEVLAARGDGLRTAWRDWVRDFVFDAPSDYGMTPAPFNSGAVRGQREETVVLPPLSYQVHDYRTSTSTLQVTARIDGPSHVLIQILVRGYADGPVEELAVNAPGEDFTLELTDLPDDALPRIAFANPYLGTADEVTVHLTLSDGVETLYEVLERICPPTLALSTGTYYPYSTGLVGGGYDGRCLECQAAQCNYATETDHVVLQATRRPPQWSESSCHPMAGFDPITYIVRHGDGVYATVATSRRTGATRPLDVELQGVVDMLHARLVGEGAGACTGPLAYETDFSLAPGAALHGSEEASVTFEYFGAPTYPLTVSWPVDGNCNGHLDCTPRTRTLDLRDTELVQSDPLGELRRFVIAGLTRCTASDPDPEPTYHIAWGVRDAEGRQIGGSVLAFRCELPLP